MESLLLVLPAGSGPGRSVAPETMVAGLPLLRRIILAGTRAGFSRILVQRTRPDVDALLAGTVAATLSGDALPPGLGAAPPPRQALDARCRIVILPGNVVPQPGWLRGLREAEIETGRVYADRSMTAMMDTDDPAAVLTAASRNGEAGGLVAVLRARFGAAELADDLAGRFPLAGPADTGPVETWLLRSLIKQREGFMSRHFERRISLALTRRLAVTRVTPDTLTLVSLTVGLLGAPFFLSSSAGHQLAGALLFLAHSILDGCDGELARLKFMESRRGALLDFWGDNVVHAAVFACMAVGLSLAREATWPLLLGAITVVAALGAAVCDSGRTLQDLAPGGTASRTARLAEAFSHRDFIYLVLALSAVGKADWFLILASVGTPVFLLLLLWVGAARRA